MIFFKLTSAIFKLAPSVENCQTSEHWKWGLLSLPPNEATLERITGLEVHLNTSLASHFAFHLE